MFGSWRGPVRRANQLIAAGKLEQAALYCSEYRIADHRSGHSVLRKLVRGLLDAANHHQARGELSASWRQLSFADLICLDSDRDMLAREMNRFVELTIEESENLLSAGKPVHATSTLGFLSERRIQDRRADQIKRVAKVLHSAEQLAAQGRINEARQELKIAAAQRPDLQFVQRRLKSFDRQENHLSGLQTRLRKAITRSAWNDAKDVSNEMLEIAPNHRVAIDARKRCDQRLGKAQLERQKMITVHQSNENLSEQVVFEDDRNFELLCRRRTDSFLMWIDGVGGYLVCPGSSVMIGQAIPDSGVDVPMLGDIRRRHAIINRLGEYDMLEAISTLSLDGQPVTEPTVLKNGHIIDFGHGVQLSYKRPHALSRCARMDFISRHRTQPWSDGVLLADDSIVLGQGSQTHVKCGNFQRDVVLFKEGENWYCKVDGPYYVDGILVKNRAPITTSSRIHFDDFSLSLETFS